MDLDRRNLDGEQGIVEGVGVMGESSGIYHHPVNFAPDRMKPVDQCALVIALKFLNLHSHVRSPCRQEISQLGMGGAPIYLGLACPKQVEVRTVYNKHAH
jgi:hypothetical protein